MKVILFGATGMVGQSVLRECLLDPDVESVLSVGRKPSGVSDQRLRDLVRPDMFDVSVPLSEFNGCDTCFFCLGVSSVGMSEADYTHLTYDLTMAWAHVLVRVNPEMRFLYVSGMGTGGGRTEDSRCTQRERHACWRARISWPSGEVRAGGSASRGALRVGGGRGAERPAARAPICLQMPFRGKIRYSARRFLSFLSHRRRVPSAGFFSKADIDSCSGTRGLRTHAASGPAATCDPRII